MLRPVSILLFALSAPLSSQSVWVVDDDAGPGVDFLHPNDALDAAEGFVRETARREVTA